MKLANIGIACLFIIFSFSSTYAQDISRETIKVWGNCGMCKTNIEKAALAAGAEEAKWNIKKKKLTVSYNPAKTSMQVIQQSIADAGYDTQDKTASQEAYDQLQSCCQYKRKGDSGASSASCCKDGNACKHLGDCSGKDCCKDGKKCKDHKACEASGCCQAKKSGAGKNACCQDGNTCKHLGDCAGKGCCKDGKKCKDHKACEASGCCKAQSSGSHDDHGKAACCAGGEACADKKACTEKGCCKEKSCCKS